MQTNKICAIVGAGPGNGLAFGRKFHEQGYTVALLARSPENLTDLKAGLPEAYTYGCDVTLQDSIEQALSGIRTDLGRIDTLIYNAGSGVFGSVDDLDADQFEQAWRTNTMGCFNTVKLVLSDMRESGGGNIVIVGATAAKRGGARFAAFASAKAAQYNLAQSLARHLGLENIHVCYAVIDGMIDIPRARKRMPEKPDDFFLDPSHIADAVYQVTQQPASAWTFEFDLRPFAESW